MVDNIRIHYLVIDRQGYAIALNVIGYKIVMMLGGGVICLISISFGWITGFIGLSTLLLCVSGIRFDIKRMVGRRVGNRIAGCW